MAACGWFLLAFIYATYIEYLEIVQEPKLAAVISLIFSWLGLLTGFLGIWPDRARHSEEEEEVAQLLG